MSENRVKLHVLLVDDDEGDTFIIEDLLEELSYDLKLNIARNGLEAFQYLQTHEEPDLILLDLNMPRMDGRQFLQKKLTMPEYQHIPVVVLTTSDAQRDIDQTYATGCNSYLIKPSGIRELLKTLEMIGTFWGKVVLRPHEPEDSEQEARI